MIFPFPPFVGERAPEDVGPPLGTSPSDRFDPNRRLVTLFGFRRGCHPPLLKTPPPRQRPQEAVLRYLHPTILHYKERTPGEILPSLSSFRNVVFGDDTRFWVLLSPGSMNVLDFGPPSPHERYLEVRFFFPLSLTHYVRTIP